MSAFHLVRRSDRTAVSTFKRVVRSPMCVFGKARIPQRYLNLLRDRFEYLLYYETDGRVDGFLVGGRDVVTVDGRKTTVFYVDVVCSQYRKGRMLLLQAEVIGQRLRCEAVALRALPHVIRYYRKLGYQTALNACHAESRRQRSHRRTELNLNHDSAGTWMTKCLAGQHPAAELRAMWTKPNPAKPTKPRRSSPRFIEN